MTHDFLEQCTVSFRQHHLLTYVVHVSSWGLTALYAVYAMARTGINGQPRKVEVYVTLEDEATKLWG